MNLSAFTLLADNGVDALPPLPTPFVLIVGLPESSESADSMVALKFPNNE